MDGLTLLVLAGSTVIAIGLLNLIKKITGEK